MRETSLTRSLLLCPNSLSSTQPLISSTDPAALPPDANDDDDEYPDLLPVPRSPTSTAPAPSATSPPSSSPSRPSPWLRRHRRPQPCRLPRLLLRLRRCLLFVCPPLLQPPLPLPFPLLFPLTIVSLPVPPPCPCSPATLDPEPTEEIPTSNPSTKVGGREGGRDRQRAVRITWEKLVRWSRSW